MENCGLMSQISKLSNLYHRLVSDFEKKKKNPNLKHRHQCLYPLLGLEMLADEHFQVRPAYFLAEVIHCFFIPLVHLSQLSVLSPVIKDFLW